MKPGSGFARGLLGERHRVAHLRRLELFDARDDEAHLAGGETLPGLRLRREYADLLAEVVRRDRHEQDAVLGPERPVHDPHEHDNPDVVIEPGVDDQGLQRGIGLPPRRGDARDDRFQDVDHTFAGLGAAQNRVLCRNADDVLDFRDDPGRLRRRQVDLVQHRHDLHALLGRGIAVRDRLRFHALRGVDHEQRPFAGGQRSRHLVREIHVPRRVDQIEVIHLTIARGVAQRRGLGLDGDAALALEVHRIEHLRRHLAVRQAAAELDEPIGQRGLAMIDVGDDREVADVLHGATGAGLKKGALESAPRLL